MHRLLLLAASLVAPAIAVTCPPEDFSTVEHFDLQRFISARWYVQQQMACALEPKDLFQCQYAEYTTMKDPSYWGFEIQGHDHIDMPDGSAKDLHPCVKVVDAARGKLEVGTCVMPLALTGPYWVVLYNETAGYAAVSGGAPKNAFPGGCRTGTGHVDSGLWIFTRAQQRDEALVREVRGLLAARGFDLDALLDVDQRGCPDDSGRRPRPRWQDKASYARWLVHESDYATVITHHNLKEVFGNIISVADGDGLLHSTGVVYTLLPGLDATAHDLTQDSRVSVTFTEKALPGSTCEGTAEDPPCGRLTINGRLTEVPAANASAANRYLWARHPQAWLWNVTHSFKPYWLAPESITDFFLIDYYGGAARLSAAEFLAAPFSGDYGARPAPPAPATGRLHPRPRFWQYASVARWLVHESDFAVVGTHHDRTEVFGNIVSISDGDGVEHSTGIIYTFLPGLDATCQDLEADSRVSLTFSEKALANGTAPGCEAGTGESPPCARLTVTGTLTPVPEANRSEALRFLFARHPEMKAWTEAHSFRPYWLAPENITEFFFIDFYGGAQHFSTREYLEAPWYAHGTTPAPAPLPPPRPADDKLACNLCGHVYDPAADGGGRAFEDLPSDWTCPVCGAPKSAYHKIISMAGGAEAWAHDGDHHPPREVIV